MKRPACLFPALLCFAALAGGEAFSAERIETLNEGETFPAEDFAAGALLREVARHQRTGDFEASWRAWMAFLAHPGRNRVDLDSFTACFLHKGCVPPGQLGALLGKSKDEVRGLASFCPHWRELREDIVGAAGDDPEVAAEVDGQLELIRSRGFWGSCAEWHSRQLAELHDRPVLRLAPSPQVLPIIFQEYSKGGVWPMAEVSFAGRTLRTLVDTGTSITSGEGADSPLASHAFDGSRLTSIVVLTSNGLQNETLIRVSSLSLGSNTFNQVLVTLAAERTNPEIGHILGMNVLLRHSAVCFDWSRAELHLGAIGPCGNGLELDRVRLTGGFVLLVEIPMQDGSTLDALLDTGAVGTYCSRTFVDRNGGDRNFSFGQHPDFEAVCREPKPLRPGATPLAPIPGQSQAIISMETLLEFDAFGWELNPLKVYLVSKAPDV